MLAGEAGGAQTWAAGAGEPANPAAVFSDDPVPWPSLALTASEDTRAAPKPRPRDDGDRASGSYVQSPARWAPLNHQSLPTATMEPVWEAFDDRPAFLHDCHFSHWAEQEATWVPVSNHREPGARHTLTMPGPGPGPGPGPLCALLGPQHRRHCPLSHVRRQKAPPCQPGQCHTMRPAWAFGVDGPGGDSTTPLPAPAPPSGPPSRCRKRLKIPSRPHVATRPSPAGPRCPSAWWQFCVGPECSAAGSRGRLRGRARAGGRGEDWGEGYSATTGGLGITALRARERGPRPWSSRAPQGGPGAWWTRFSLCPGCRGGQRGGWTTPRLQPGPRRPATGWSLIKALALLFCPLGPHTPCPHRHRVEAPGPSRSPRPELGPQGGRCQQTARRPYGRVAGYPCPGPCHGSSCPKGPEQ